jgi:hypothetical protein
MKTSFYDKTFILGFVSCFYLFVFLNYQNYVILYDRWEKEPGYIVGWYEFGFPFNAHCKYISQPLEVNILWAGFLANVLVALICSFAVGSFCKFISTKIITHSNSLK